MKTCSKCKVNKDIEEFSFKNKSSRIRQSQCKNCTRLLIKSHYNNNKEYYLNKAKNRNTKLKSTTLDYLQKILLGSKCIDCGESDPVVLEFDHNGEIPKFKAVSSLIRNRYNLGVIKEEVAKCEIRCANCHRRKTARDFNWYKNNMRP